MCFVLDIFKIGFQQPFYKNQGLKKKRAFEKRSGESVVSYHTHAFPTPPIRAFFNTLCSSVATPSHGYTFGVMACDLRRERAGIHFERFG
jgi:hypothetical protein